MPALVLQFPKVDAKDWAFCYPGVDTNSFALSTETKRISEFIIVFDLLIYSKPRRPERCNESLTHPHRNPDAEGIFGFDAQGV